MHFGHLLFPFQYAIDLDDPVIPKSVTKHVILRLATLLTASETKKKKKKKKKGRQVNDKLVVG